MATKRSGNLGGEWECSACTDLSLGLADQGGMSDGAKTHSSGGSQYDWLLYSQDRATAGSTFVARFAGIQDASSDRKSTTPAMTT